MAISPMLQGQRRWTASTLRATRRVTSAHTGMRRSMPSLAHSVFPPPLGSGTIEMLRAEYGPKPTGTGPGSSGAQITTSSNRAAQRSSCITTGSSAQSRPSASR